MDNVSLLLEPIVFAIFSWSCCSSWYIFISFTIFLRYSFPLFVLFRILFLPYECLHLTSIPSFIWICCSCFSRHISFLLSICWIILFCLFLFQIFLLYVTFIHFFLSSDYIGLVPPVTFSSLPLSAALCFFPGARFSMSSIWMSPSYISSFYHLIILFLLFLSHFLFFKSLNCFFSILFSSRMLFSSFCFVFSVTFSSCLLLLCSSSCLPLLAFYFVALSCSFFHTPFSVRMSLDITTSSFTRCSYIFHPIS